MEFDFRGTLKFCRQNSRLIEIGEEQRVLYKRPKCIYNHNPPNYLNNVEYFRESSEENQNTIFLSNKFLRYSFFWYVCVEKILRDRQTGHRL